MAGASRSAVARCIQPVDILADYQLGNPDYKKCELDTMLGFNAYAYRKRFARVEELARQDLERRGFEVRFLEICLSDIAIGVKWIIDF